MTDTADQTRPLAIAVLVRMFPNIVQTYVLSHILGLKACGHHTRIIAEADPKQREVHPRVTENRLLDETVYINADNTGLLRQCLATPILRPRYLRLLLATVFSPVWKQYGFAYGIKSLLRLKALCGTRFDIIHSHSLFCSYDYLFLKTCFSIPLTTTFHGLVPKNVEMLAPEKIRAVLAAGDVFFVNTVFAQRQLIELGCDRQKIRIVPQGTNLEDFPFTPRKIHPGKPVILLSVGRLSIEKGFHIAIEAVARIVHSHPDVRYHIVGGGPEEDALRRLIEKHRLQDIVTIFGAISTESLLEHYSSSHVFILPSIDFRDGSHTETQGVVLQEAQATGLPVVASRTGGIPEVIRDGETGLLFEEENIDQLSRHLNRLIEDPALYERLHLDGRRDVEANYSSTVICRRLGETYRQILSSTR